VRSGTNERQRYNNRKTVSVLGLRKIIEKDKWMTEWDVLLKGRF